MIQNCVNSVLQCWFTLSIKHSHCFTKGPGGHQTFLRLQKLQQMCSSLPSTSCAKMFSVCLSLLPSSEQANMKCEIQVSLHKDIIKQLRIFHFQSKIFTSVSMTLGYYFLLILSLEVFKKQLEMFKAATYMSKEKFLI